jgi:putative aldouronate transport system substrate-binding protein
VPAGTPSARPTSAGSLLPTYVPSAVRPTPDFPSAGPQYEDGYSTYPANPVQAVATTPGSGSTLTAFVPGLQPPPTPLAQNPAWQEVNRQLGATFTFNLTPFTDYSTKLATIMAGSDLPDVISFYGGYAAAAHVPTFLEQPMADLAPYLAGDAARDYPHLAAIPTFAWKNAGSVYDGHLYLLPIERYLPGTILLRNVSVYDQEIGADYVPKDADDFKRVLQQLNRPDQGRWATGSYQGVAYDIVYYASVFGAPNNWRLEASGNLVKNFETPEFKAAVGFVRDLVAAGLFHPNTLQYAGITQASTDFAAGKWAVYVNAFGLGWVQVWRQGLQRQPPVDFLPVAPFAARAGDRPVHYLGAGFQSATAIKKSSPDRIKEVLRIMNWLAAPFGSQEDLLLTAGIKDVDYTLDANGNPVLTERGNQDANNVPWKYTIQHPQVMYQPDIPAYARAAYAAEQLLIPQGVADPTLGYYSPTLGAQGVVLQKTFMDGLTDVIGGRRPLSDYDQLVRDWQNGGGNQARSELLRAMAADG